MSLSPFWINDKPIPVQKKVNSPVAEICKTGNRQIRPNFNETEIYSRSPDAPECHFQSDITLDAIQYLRTYYGVPFSLTSTFRTISHNNSVGGASSSKHLTGDALDGQPMQNRNLVLAHFRNEILTQGPVFQKLFEIGIRGFGIYNTFLHLDSRTNGGSKSYNGQTYALWDKSSYLANFDFGNYDPSNAVAASIQTESSPSFTDYVLGIPAEIGNATEQIFSGNDEDGYTAYSNNIKNPENSMLVFWLRILVTILISIAIIIVIQKLIKRGRK